MGKLTIILAVLLSSAVHAADLPEFVAGFGASNAQCGRGEPTAFVDFRQSHQDMPVRVYVSTGPDGGCAGQTTAVDASASRRWALRGPWGVSVAGEYRRRVVPFEYGCPADADCVALPGKLFRGVAVETVSALAGVRYSAERWSVEVRYDAVRSAWSDGGGMPPISVAGEVRAGPLLVEATLLPRGVADIEASLRLGRARVSARMAARAGLLEHPAPDFVAAGDQRWSRLAAPTVVYAVDVGVRF